jgi:hypothetical protein
MRSECATMVHRWEKEAEARGTFLEVHSHYAPERNRCLMSAQGNNGAGVDILNLRDAQSDAFLAACSGVDGRWKCQIGQNYDVTHDQVLGYIASTMEGD